MAPKSVVGRGSIVDALNLRSVWWPSGNRSRIFDKYAFAQLIYLFRCDSLVHFWSKFLLVVECPIKIWCTFVVVCVIMNTNGIVQALRQIFWNDLSVLQQAHKLRYSKIPALTWDQFLANSQFIFHYKHLNRTHQNKSFAFIELFSFFFEYILWCMCNNSLLVFQCVICKLVLWIMQIIGLWVLRIGHWQMLQIDIDDWFFEVDQRHRFFHGLMQRKCFPHIEFTGWFI